MSEYDKEVRYMDESRLSAPASPSYVPMLGSDLEGQGRHESGGALREEIEQIPSLSKKKKVEVPIASAVSVTECKCKTKQATEGDRLAALAAMKMLALVLQLLLCQVLQPASARYFNPSARQDRTKLEEISRQKFFSCTDFVPDVLTE